MKNFLIVVLFILSTLCSSASFNYYRVTGGATITLQPQNISNDDIYYVYSSGAVVLGSDYNLVSASMPPVGRHWRVVYNVTSTTVGVRTFNFFGTLINFADAGLRGYIDFQVVTDHTGSPHIESTRGPLYINAGVPGSPTIFGASITDGSLPFTAFETLPAGYIIVGDISNVAGGVAMNGDATLDDAGTITVGSGKITSGKILDGTIVNADVNASASIAWTKLATGTISRPLVTDGSGVVTTTAYIGANQGGTAMNTSASTGFATVSAGTWAVGSISQTITFPVSFESGEQCNNRFQMPACAGNITNVYAVCTKAIAGTDNATITLKNSAGTSMGSGVVTFTASDPLETAYQVTPNSNTSFASGGILYAVTSKATAGGKALVTITYTRTN